MSLNEEVELLRRIPLFAKIEASKLKLLAFTSQRLTYKPGDVLFRQGDPGDAAFVIIGGEADVMVDTPGGQLKVAHLKQNDFVGEIAILCDVPRTATVIASTEVTTLRIEKGHVAGPELDGRTTARDLGLGRMLSAKKAYVGQKLMARPGLADPKRPALVGLKPLDRGRRLRGGAHLVENPRRASGATSLGHVTSVAHSPTLGHWIALALVSGGPARIGRRLYTVDPLRGETVAVDVVEPVFVDPEGARVRA